MHEARIALSTCATSPRPVSVTMSVRRRSTSPVISRRWGRISPVHWVRRIRAVPGSATSVTMPVVVISVVMVPVVVTTVVIVTVVVVPIVVVPIVVPFFMVSIVVIILRGVVSIISSSVRVPSFTVLPLFCFFLLFFNFGFFLLLPRFFLYNYLLDWQGLSFHRRTRSFVDTDWRLREVLRGLFFDGGSWRGFRGCRGREIYLVRGWRFDRAAGSRLHVVRQSFLCGVFTARDSCLVLLDLGQGLLLHVLLYRGRNERTELVPQIRYTVKSAVSG